MLNPRDLYIRACFSTGASIQTDYFEYVKPEDTALYTKEGQISAIALHLGTNNVDKLKVLKDVIKDNKGTAPIKEAYALFTDMSNRILLEGFLLNFTIDQVAQLRKTNRLTLDAYCTYFFNLQDFQSFDSHLIFQSLITEEEAQSWFRVCSVKTFDEFNYLTTGKIPYREAADGLQALRDKALQDFLTYCHFPQDALTKGLTADQERLIKAAQRSGALAAKAMTTELQNADLMKTVKDFLAAFKIDVVQDDTSTFDVDTEGQYDDGTNIEDDLRKQFEKVSPLTVDEESDLPEEEEDGD